LTDHRTRRFCIRRTHRDADHAGWAVGQNNLLHKARELCPFAAARGHGFLHLTDLKTRAADQLKAEQQQAAVAIHYLPASAWDERKSAWRDESPLPGDRNKGDGKRYGGFYTQDELREVVAYATKLHINVVPEIEMPGHAGAAIAAYPNLGNSDIKGYAPKVNTRWGVQYYIFAPKEETFRFIDDIFAELCPIFPSVYFHIGGDEAPKNQWDNSAFAKEVMKREGLKNSHELQSYFIKRVEKLLAARGKKLIGWDEIQEGGLSKSATMMVWRDWKWAHHAVNNGNDIVMATTSHTYFDYGQGPTPKGAQYEVIGGNLPVEKVYSLDPVPTDFTPEQRKRVLGCQGQLWTEYGFNWSKVEYLTFPRACALAEVLWSPQEGREWKNFKGRLDNHLKLLDAAKVNYRKEDGSPAVTDKMSRGE
jgi:hexosaminidase